MQNDFFLYAIPSYNRAKKQSTVNYLNQIGVPRSMIYVFVQTENDLNDYAKTVGGKANIVFQYAERGVEARNNILSAMRGRDILMLDDDIRAIGELKNGKLKKITSADRMNALFSDCFGECEKICKTFFGVYPIYNAYFMEDTISTRSPINTVFGFSKFFSEEYDETYDTKEDAALCAKILSSGRKILRYNFLAVDADHRKTKDGYIDKWHQEENIRCVKKIVKEYPEIYKAQTNKPWEVRSLVKDEKIKVDRTE